MPWWLNQSGDAKPFFNLRRLASVALQRLRRVGPEQPAGVSPPQADLAPVKISQLSQLSHRRHLLHRAPRRF